MVGHLGGNVLVFPTILYIFIASTEEQLSTRCHFYWRVFQAAQL